MVYCMSSAIHAFSELAISDNVDQVLSMPIGHVGFSGYPDQINKDIIVYRVESGLRLLTYLTHWPTEQSGCDPHMTLL